MKNSNKLSSAFGYIALTSGSIWFGSYLSRLLITFQMFEETELVLKNYITDKNLSAIFQTIFPLVNLSFYSYLVMVISFTLFLIFSKLKFKQNGWLLIITLIIYLTFPLESILLITDYKLILLFLQEQFGSEQILQFTIERINKLNGFPIIMLLSYFTIPYFLIFKPFTVASKDEN
ncbi:MAG: hypothetical protein HXY48_04475 [Ignavibacteriaceae bacterium]|nr:hypothetical protein [Ignavibacteriaceae bacterium]